MKNNEPIRLLSSQELRRLGELLEKEEIDIKNSRAYTYISGGFAKCEMFGYDNQIIDVKVKHGVQSDVANDTHEENLRINRETMEIV